MSIFKILNFYIVFPNRTLKILTIKHESGSIDTKSQPFISFNPTIHN